MKKARTSPAKYKSRKSVATKISQNGKTRTVEMPWSRQSVFALTADTISSTVIAANDLYAVQPMGRDQMFALYDKAYVKGCEIEITFAPGSDTASSSSGLVQLNVWADTNPGASGSINESIQRCLAHGGKRDALMYTAKTDGDQSGFIRPMKVTMSAFTKAITNHGMESDELSQLITGGPENKWYFHVEKVCNKNTEQCTMIEVAKFNTVFYDPKELAVS